MAISPSTIVWRMRVFISHRREDHRIAEAIGSRLGNRGYQVWTSSDLIPGENWWRAKGQALDRSDAMIVLLTPESVKSEWLRNDIGFALGSAKYRDRLIPVVTRGTKEIPWILKRLPQLRYDAADPQKTVKLITAQLAAKRPATRLAAGPIADPDDREKSPVRRTGSTPMHKRSTASRRSTPAAARNRGRRVGNGVGARKK